ncbi:hypothetical protein DNTS_029828 [Danionella cerebrum]|uniref:Uncharacterized protein n=1 Tax=Danionella cerebrum TaxID=2873325 RepID=A0A553QRH1_9TELE|nr:hypothetical protein DNTS_029828 [Danionella translucida]
MTASMGRGMEASARGTTEVLWSIPQILYRVQVRRVEPSNTMVRKPFTSGFGRCQLAALTPPLIKHSGPTPEADMAPQTTTNCGYLTLDFSPVLLLCSPSQAFLPLFLVQKLLDLGNAHL